MRVDGMGYLAGWGFTDIFMNMFCNFRRSAGLLHTLAGVPLSLVLFIVFLTGSITYFRMEIALWMQPELHRAQKGTQGFDRVFSLLQKHAEKTEKLSIYLPGARRNTIYAWWFEPKSDTRPQRQICFMHFDPVSGEQVTPRKSNNGNLFYRMHYRLHGVGSAGAFLVNIAAMAMFIALITGVIIHKTVIRDFFTFRPGKGRLSWRDTHTTTGMLALPFYFVLCFSGLLLVCWFYFPDAITSRYRDGIRTFYKEAFLQTELEQKHLPQASAENRLGVSLKQLLTETAKYWPDEMAERITLLKDEEGHPNIEIHQAMGKNINYRNDMNSLVFDGVTGALLAVKTPKKPSAIIAMWNTMYSLHVGRFASPLPRFLLFFSGLLGSLMFASGLILWASRYQLPKSTNKYSVPFTIVSIANMTILSGLVIAIGVYFWSNRLLPTAMESRDEWEVHVFSIGWAITLLHALLRRPHSKAWKEQFFAAGLLFSLIPLLNGLTGGAHLGQSIPNRLWIVAGFDLVALFFGVVFFAISMQPKEIKNAVQEK